MTIGWGIVSTGRHPDTKMAPAINEAEDASLAAVMSRDIGRAEAFAQKHGAATAYDDLDALLRDPAVDVVYIASPNALHAEQTVRAAGAGKHVIVEKPMALSVDDAQRMIEACDSAGVLLGVGFHLRAHEGHQRLRSLVTDGAVGQVSFAQASWCRGVRGQEAPPPRTGLQAWWDDPSLIGAGAFMATGVHCADLLRYVLSDDVAEVSAVSDATPEKPLEELVTLAFRFTSGAIATLLTGRRTPDYESNDVMVYGTLGRAGLRSSIEMTQGGALAVRTDALTEDATYPEHPFALYTKQVCAFDAAVEGNGEPLATGLDGLRVVEITLAMVESARTGSRVSLR
ncbi:MAG: Gfo/Idh/MocA family oxidoreductase [Chloroflexi bacterium]|nr:Gfo/Idh/MocA family oxidoreductase [Chloroflexota bacterium]